MVDANSSLLQCDVYKCNMHVGNIHVSTPTYMQRMIKGVTWEGEEITLLHTLRIFAVLPRRRSSYIKT